VVTKFKKRKIKWVGDRSYMQGVGMEEGMVVLGKSLCIPTTRGDAGHQAQAPPPIFIEKKLNI